METTAEMIPKDQWPAFFLQVSAEHRGETVNIGVLSPELENASVQVETECMGEIAHEAPLQDITLQPKGTAFELAVTTGQEGKRVHYPIHEPSQVRVMRDRAGALRAIQVDDSRDDTTLICFT